MFAAADILIMAKGVDGVPDAQAANVVSIIETYSLSDASLMMALESLKDDGVSDPLGHIKRLHAGEVTLHMLWATMAAFMKHTQTKPH